jgi:putative membrane protein
MEKDIKNRPDGEEGGSKGAAKADPRNDLAMQRTNLASDRTDMAVARTTMAADRTLLSWVRTSLSLMGFGFTIYKFLVYLLQMPGNAEKVSDPEGPKLLGIIMLSASVLCIVFGMIEYYDIFRRFGRQQNQKLWGTAFIMAILTALLSIFLLVSIISNIRGF